ncbi:MAG: S8 family serine peptidase [Bacteroidales bacterium]|jgi:subtilisin family serine protease|nr:S8 family serine peptidase [Bacteroidales bacterium]
MKKGFLIISLTIFFSLFLKAQEQSGDFYYYFDKKVFLQQRTDKLFLKFTQDADAEQVRSIINNNKSLKTKSDTYLERSPLRVVILDNKEKKQISPNIIESLKTNKEVVSATFLLENKDSLLIGLTDEFIVKFKETTSYEQLQRLADQYECTIGKENQFEKGEFIISVSKKSKFNAMQTANLFQETSLFEYSSPNFIFFNIFHSNDTFFDQQWGLKNTGQGSGTSGIDIKAEQAWNITKGNPNIRIAVIDEGVDLTHPDLKANLLPGFDATGQNSGGAPTKSYENHGTACAGIIGAIQNNGKGISGVAPNCKIIPIHVSFDNMASANWFANAIRWAWQNGADVISNSWHCDSVSIITNAINNAISQGREGKGCVVVFAAGNNNVTAVNYPAYLPNVIAVGAISPCGSRKRSSKNKLEVNIGVQTDIDGVSCDGEAWWGSNYGSALDVMAPGVSIYTTDRTGNAGYNATDYKTNFNGTSAACPFVAGIAALVLSVNPCLTQQEVRNCIEMSCEKVGPYCYSTTSGRSNGSWNNQMGYGLVNAYKAVLYAHSSQTHNFSNITGNTYGGATNNYQFVTSQSSCALVPGVFNVKRTEVRATISYLYTPAPIVVGTANGFSAASPNNTKQYIGVVSISETSATVNTYVYEGFNVLGQNLGWFPCSPSNVKFNFKILSGFDNDLYIQNRNETGTASYQAINTISSGNYTIKSGANVTFHAGKSITLSEGFKAEAGSSFKAYVEPYFSCTFSLKSAPATADTDSLPFITDFSVEKSTLIEQEVTELEKSHFKLYPNPTTNNITIEYQLPNSAENVEIVIHDNNGRLVYKLNNTISHESGVYTLSLQTVNLPTGTYICTLKTNKQIFTEKFIKQ